MFDFLLNLFPKREEEKKYKLTEDTLSIGSRTLHRIIALKDFGYVKKGELGGWIENEGNLSQYGHCWVFDDAKVYDNAKVSEDARIYNNATIKDCARVYESAVVSGNATVQNFAVVYDTARVRGNAQISGNAVIYAKAEVIEYAKVRGQSRIRGNAVVGEKANISGNTCLSGEVNIGGNASISNCRIYQPIEIGSNTVIRSIEDFIVFKNWWSSGRSFIWTRSNNMWQVGCFYGTGEELIKKAYKDSEKSGREYERVVKYVESILK